MMKEKPFKATLINILEPKPFLVTASEKLEQAIHKLMELWELNS